MTHTVDHNHGASERRLMWLFLFIAVCGLMGYGLYAQYVLYYDPCPLCLTQRAFYIGVGLMALLGIFTARKFALQGLLATVAGLSALGGIVTAGRQVWLQHLPPEKVPECGPGLEYWLDNMPLLETLKLLFQGDGNCAEVDWTFLGFSMAEWSLAWFALFLLVAVVLLIRTMRRQS